MTTKKILRKVLSFFGIQRKPDLFDIQGWYYYFLEKLHATKVSFLLTYGGATFLALSVIGMNVFSFVVCLSIIFPEFKTSLISNTAHFQYAVTTQEPSVQTGANDTPTESTWSTDVEDMSYLESLKEEFFKKHTPSPLPQEKDESTFSFSREVAKLWDIFSDKKPVTEVELESARETQKSISVSPTGLETLKVPTPTDRVDTPKKETPVPVSPKETPKVIPVPKDTLAKTLYSEIQSQVQKLDAPIFEKFSKRILKSDNMFLEDGVWYTYVYPNYQSFGKGVVPSSTDIVSWGLKYDSTVLMLDGKVWAAFLTNYTKVKLVSDSIIAGVADKRTFLRELVDDKKYIHGDTDEVFKKLKSTSQDLTSGLGQSKKIAKVYNYITSNISYTTKFDTSNKKLSSGIETYSSKVWACGGYSKLFLYMLSFAGVSDVSVVRGHVVDAADFPNIGHAWVRVWGLYYDPTFDDPVWASKARGFWDYKYFALPKDIFYTNRFNVWTLPSSLKSGSMSARKEYVQEQLYKVADKYKNADYALLEWVSFRKKYGLTAKDTITLSILKDIVPYYEVVDNAVIENDTLRAIQDVKFYRVDEGNIDTLLKQISYNLDGYKLFKWDDGSYRLAYKVEYKEISLK